MWTCQNCGEHIEDTFDACWNCGTSIDGTLDPDFCTEPEITEVTAIETEGPADGDPLQSLIAKILESEARGEAIDLGALIEAHPEHANSLRERWHAPGRHLGLSGTPGVLSSSTRPTSGV